MNQNTGEFLENLAETCFNKVDNLNCSNSTKIRIFVLDMLTEFNAQDDSLQKKVKAEVLSKFFATILGYIKKIQKLKELREEAQETNFFNFENFIKDFINTALTNTRFSVASAETQDEILTSYFEILVGCEILNANPKEMADLTREGRNSQTSSLRDYYRGLRPKIDSKR